MAHFFRRRTPLASSLMLFKLRAGPAAITTVQGVRVVPPRRKMAYFVCRHFECVGHIDVLVVAGGDLLGKLADFVMEGVGLGHGPRVAEGQKLR